MKWIVKFLKFSVPIACGIVLGVVITWHHFHDTEIDLGHENISYEKVMDLSGQHILEENFSCENYVGRSVGEVFSYILELNNSRYMNTLSRSCFGDKCSISASTCRPWQSDSCGSVILYFELISGSKIDPTSFKCIQMP
jgi:hypothetical protein